jgi:hypothetical protein
LFLSLADNPGAALSFDDRARHLPGTWDRFAALGLLAEAELAGAVACNSCGRDHVEPVVWADGPGRSRRVYIPCRAHGRVPVDPDRLRRWRVAGGELAWLLTDELGATGGLAERVPGRVWRLGRAPAGGRSRPAFLAVGLARPDAAGVVARAPELADPTAVVLVPSAGPPPAVWGTAGGPVVVPLTDLIALGAGGLSTSPGMRSMFHAPHPPV